MQLNWTTFILEIVNFLILVWILKRLFYMPIKKAIENRKHTIQQSLDKADKVHKEAVDLQQRYENRLAEWEHEKEEKSIHLQEELEQEKTRQLAALRKTLDKETEKIKVREQHKITDLINKKEQEANIQSVKFAAKLLEQFACHELEEKIIELFLEHLANMPAKKIQMLKNELAQDEKVTLQIRSAFSLHKPQKDLLNTTLTKLLDKKITLNFIQDSELLAGLRVSIGSMLIHANLHDELRFFSGVAVNE